MGKVELLQMGPYPDWDQKPLDDAFVMHRYFDAADKAAILAEVGRAGMRRARVGGA